MKTLASLIGLFCASGALAQTPSISYPSCAASGPHVVKPGAHGKTAGQAQVAARINMLEADFGTARKAGRISAAKVQQLEQRLTVVRTTGDRLVHKQGFLSAAEQASLNRQMDPLTRQFCG